MTDPVADRVVNRLGPTRVSIGLKKKKKKIHGVGLVLGTISRPSWSPSINIALVVLKIRGFDILMPLKRLNDKRSENITGVPY